MNPKVVLFAGMMVLHQIPTLGQTTAYTGKTLEASALKEDFRLLKTAIEGSHPNLYKYSDKTRMDSLFKAIEENLTKPMGELEFYRSLLPVFNHIKCGHTRMAPPESAIRHLMEGGLVFPADVRIIGGEVFVCGNFTEETRLPVGTRIRSINGQLTTDLLRQMMPATFADGSGLNMRYRLMEREFFFFYFLMVGEPAEFLLACTDEAGKNFQVTVPAKPLKDRTIKRKPMLDFANLEESVGLVTIKTFDDRRVKGGAAVFNRFVDSVFHLARSNSLKKMIIDVRGNDGGNPALVAHLLKQFSPSEFSLLNRTQFTTDKRSEYFGDNLDTAAFYQLKLNNMRRYEWIDTTNDWYGSYTPVKERFEGKIMVLMDGGSFSSTGFFGTLVKHYKAGKIIGEESGGGCYCNDCHAVLQLPNSGLQANIARCYVTLACMQADCEGHGVIPDYPVSQKPSDLAKDKDTVLEFALQLKD